MTQFSVTQFSAIRMGCRLALQLTMFIAVLCFSNEQNVQAWDGNSRIYAKSTAPYWEVGRRDNDLSRLCQIGLFNQKYTNRMYIQFSGKTGRGLTGIAKKFWNLVDPLENALEEKTYHFYRDGTSQCIVFVSP